MREPKSGASPLVVLAVVVGACHDSGCGAVPWAVQIGTVRALSLDETLFVREGPWRTQRWSTQMVDARNGQLLDVVAGRTADALACWLEARDPAWRARIQWAVMDLSGPYRATFDTMLHGAVQVADPFHVVKVRHEALCVPGRVRDPPLWPVAAGR